MFLRGSRGDREEARRGGAEGHPRVESAAVCGGGFFWITYIYFWRWFLWLLWVRKAPRASGEEKSLFFN